MSTHMAHRLLLGSSAWSAHASEQVTRAAASRQNVLITGPRGTGKKYIARLIHDQSSDCTRAFVPLSCELLPTPLFESQLFGHVRSALVAPSGAALGCLRVADSGTVLLDCPAALDIVSQERLLRALRDRQYSPIGSTEIIDLNARFIAISSDDLRLLVDEGRFLRDLYDALAPLAITTVSLQERAEDISALAEHFLAERSAHVTDRSAHSSERTPRFSSDAMRWMQSYTWPGNVGELKRLVDRCADGGGEVDLEAVLGATAVLAGKPYVRKMLRHYVGFSGLRSLEVHACRLDQARHADRWH
jgi:DNA-binding NtrC family response regulator